LSTNAGGVQVLRYGNARDLCLGLEVVLPDGRIWHGLRGLRKDNTGYDLKQLFIGGEGTLGLITGAVLKLFPRPRQVATAWVAVTDPSAAVRLLGHLRTAVGDRLTAFELVGRQGLDMVLRHIPGSQEPLADRPHWQVLLELSDTTMDSSLDGLLEAGLTTAIDAGLVNDAAVAQSQAQARALWALRENISEAQKREGLSVKHDVSLPVSHVAEFIGRADAALAAEFPGVRIVCFGHLGDGNLHYNPSKPDSQSNAEFIARTGEVNRIVHDLVHSLGGSISAEHGLGQLKREEILRYKSPVEMALMGAIKGALDPQGIMNPGKLL
jgi:FAD/FMN-containing dehydrogenase